MSLGSPFIALLSSDSDICCSFHIFMFQSQCQTGIILCLSAFSSYVAIHFMPVPTPTKLHPHFMYSILGYFHVTCCTLSCCCHAASHPCSVINKPSGRPQHSVSFMHGGCALGHSSPCVFIGGHHSFVSRVEKLFF